MEKIASGVFIEDSYPGVVVGAVPVGEGVLLVDAPLRPDDGRSWLATLRGLKGGADRVLVYLDAHTDRTLGGRMLDSTVIAHKKVLKRFDDRSSIFKAQIQESGDVWETCTGLSGIRWAPPDLAFSHQARLHWKEAEVLLLHQPGPEPGAIWTCMPEQKVLFVGDLVTVSRPPFLGQSNLTAWEESLDTLASDFKDYLVVSGRDGLVTEKDFKSMKKIISNIGKQLDRLNRKKAKPEETEKLVDKLMGSFQIEPRFRNHYYQRLKYGLAQCYATRYLKLKNFAASES
jgi:glyoxylase-like metal-dependent hydrolase (beta-lactamase superfamily II)